MSTKLHELIEKATPGPWDARYMGSGDWGIHATNENSAMVHSAGDVPRTQAEANSKLSARCNPETMKAVLEALEKANKTFAYSEGAHGNDALFAIRHALSILNGESP